MAEVDTSVHLERCKALPVQGQTARQFEDRAAGLWSQAVLTPPDHVMRFALNAVTDTLPHNANLHLWGKKPSSGCQLCPERQTLQHVLNHCSVALERRRYNQRHDDVLRSLFKFISSHLQPGHQVTADLPGEHCCFPQDVATTDSRPDIVIWSDQSIILVELTIPFEPGMDAAAERKQAKYADLLARCRTICHSHFITIEVGSRGFINATSFDKLYSQLFSSKQSERQELEAEITRNVIARSHDIWWQRNWLGC